MTLLSLPGVMFGAANSKLKNNLSSGSDGLPPLLYKRLKHPEPLSLAFTQLLSVSDVGYQMTAVYGNVL